MIDHLNILIAVLAKKIKVDKIKIKGKESNLGAFFC